MLKKKFYIFLTILLYGCSDSALNVGVWHSKVEDDSYVLLTNSDAKEIGEYPPAPFADDNNMQNWIMVKNIDEAPEKIKSELQAYSINVVEHGFVFLGITYGNDKDLSFDDVEWGWRIKLKNKSKHNVYAYGDYKLFDKDGFPLTTTQNADWDSKEEGVLIKSGEDAILKGRYHWAVKKNSIPFLPKRAARGDYKLFLRHNFYENWKVREKIQK